MQKNAFKRLLSLIAVMVLVWNSLPGGLWQAETALAADGTSMASAYPFTPPGPLVSSITSLGYTWYSVNLAANRTFVISATYKTRIDLYNAGNTQVASCYYSWDYPCRYAPTTAGTYYIKVSGTAYTSTTLTSEDGSSFASAYVEGNMVGRTIPANDSALYKVEMEAGQPYVLDATGPAAAAGFTVYNSGQTQVASGTAATLNFTPGASGTYYVRLNTGASSGSYVLNAAAAHTPPGPQTNTFSSYGSLWYRLDLAASRTIIVSATNKTKIEFYNGAGTQAVSCYYSWEFPCLYAPTTAGAYYVKVSGTANSSTTLTSEDGASFATAYVEGNFTSRKIPANASALYKVEMEAGQPYVLDATGPAAAAGFTVYDSAQTQVASGTAPTLNFTPGVSGTYYVRLSTGASGGSYVLNAAAVHTPPGPQTNTFSSYGNLWYRLDLAASRTIIVSATNKTKIEFYNGAGTQAVSCYYSWEFPCLYAPTTAGAYYVKVSGTASSSTTLTSEDGASFATAYVEGNFTSRKIPANASALYKVEMEAGQPYVLDATGPGAAAGFTVYDGVQTQVASGTGATLNFTPNASGTYYVQLSTGASSGSYVLNAAVAYTPPGPQTSTFSSHGSLWYRLDLAASRTIKVSATNRSKIEFYNGANTQLVSCYYSWEFPCVYAPATAGTYYVKVSGTASSSTTLTSEDGASFVTAYVDANFAGRAIPANDSALYKVDLEVGQPYVLAATGPGAAAGFTVYDGVQTQVASGTGATLNFTPSASGTYYVRLSTGASSGSYVLNAAVAHTPPGPQTNTFSSLGNVWYRLELPASRTIKVSATNKSQIEFYNGAGTQVVRCYYSWEFPCLYSPTTAGTYYVKVSGTANSSTVLTSEDGASFATAYVDGNFVGRTIPANDSALYKLELEAGQPYVLAATGPGAVAGFAVYNSAQTQVAGGTGATLNFTPGASGTYYVRLNTGASSGSYVLNAAVAHTPPGPQTNIFSGLGNVWYRLELPASRTIKVSATNKSQIEFYNSAGTQVVRCYYSWEFPCLYSPTTAGTYYVKVSGTANSSTVLTSEDGVSFATAYVEGNFVGRTIPANDSSLYKVEMEEAQSYVLAATGPGAAAGFTVYDGAQAQVAGGTAATLNFTPGATGTYYVRLSTGASSGSYVLNAALVHTPPGPETNTFPSYGSLWYRLDLPASRTTVVSATNKSQMEFYNGAGTQAVRCYYSWEYPCVYAPTTAGTYYVKVSGTAGASTKFTSEDGLSFATAYHMAFGNGVASKSASIPANGSALFTVELAKGAVTLAASGPGTPVGLTVYDSAQAQVASGSGASLTFTAPAGGVYYVSLGAGTSNGSNTLTVTQPHTPPGPEARSITTAGYSWYQVNLTATNRTYTFSATGATRVDFYNSAGSYLTGCNYSSICNYVPTAAGTYYVKVSGAATAGTTLTSQDGASFAGAYVDGISVAKTIPGSDSGLYSMQLLAGKSYLLEASGASTPAGLTVYNSAQSQVASGTGTTLTYTPAAGGTYYVRLSAGTTTGSYTLKVSELYTAPGPQTSSISSQGYTWYRTNLSANSRTFRLTATGATKIEFYDGSGTYLTGCSSDNCGYLPATSATDYVKVSGTPNAASTLTSQDGSSSASAYALTFVGGVASQTNNAPARDALWYAATLRSGRTYSLSSSGASTPAGIAVYSPSNLKKSLASTTATTLSFTPPADGTYYVKLSSGTTAGYYTLNIQDPFVAELTMVPNAKVYGVVSVTGTAVSVTGAWELSYGSGTAPTSWTTLKTSYTGVSASVLYQWDTYTLANGLYTLKLVASGQSGLSETATVTVEVANNPLQLSGPTAATTATLDLAWQVSSTTGMSRFELYKSTSSGAGFGMYSSNKVADITDLSKRTYQVTGLTAATAYYFKLRAVYLDGHTEDSNEVAGATRPAAVPQTGATVEVTTFVYDADGNRIRMTDPNGNTTTYEYNAVSEVVASNQPDGSRIAYTYDKAGQVLSANDGTAAGVTQWEYNAVGNTTKLTDPDGGVTTSAYDARGHLTSLTRASGTALAGTTAYTRDVMGRLTAVTDPRGNVIRYEYDANGNQTKATDPNGNVTQFVYDAMNRSTSVTDPLLQVTTTDYDAVGHRTRVTLPNQSVWLYTYNERGQLLSVTEPTGTVTTQTYDTAGRLLSVTDGNGHTTTYGYDSLGNVATERDPLNGMTRYTYDGNGNVIKMQDPKGSVITYSYDGLDRLAGTQEPSLSPISFQYDGNGRRTVMTDGTGTTQYAYTAGGRISSKTMGGKSVGYTYDAAGRLATTTDYSGAVITRTYDAASRLVQVQDGLEAPIGYAYDAGGRRSSLTLPGGLVVTYGYDANNKVTQVVSRRSDNTVVNQFTYAYDSVGNISSRTDGSGTTAYTYDGAGRLASYRKPDTTTASYTYDGAGNRLTETTVDPLLATSTKSYTYDAANRMLGISGAATATYTYDANGNLMSDGADTYGYDVLNRLTSISGGNSATYAYDGDGYRVTSVEGGATTRFYWDDDQIGLETNGAGQMIARNLYGLERIARILGPGSPAYQPTGNNRGYYLHDAHGDVKAIADPSGAVIANLDYDPWGKVTEQTGTFDNPYRSGGEYQDAGTGLYYLRARFYAPEQARFLTEDTYAGDPGDPLSLNLYTYVVNNPLRYTDPSGHLPIGLDGNPLSMDPSPTEDSFAPDLRMSPELDSRSQQALDDFKDNSGSGDAGPTKPQNTNPQNPPSQAKPCTAGKKKDDPCKPKKKPDDKKKKGPKKKGVSKAEAQKFIDDIKAAAQELQAKTGIPWEAIAAQAALETGYGQSVTHDMNNGRDSHNLFNIKGSGPAGSVTARVPEYVGGKKVWEIADFKAYNDVGESMPDYQRFITGQKRYTEAMKHADDPDRYVEELQKAGYATDPNYAKKLKWIMKHYCMKK
ncbi:MAG TPA: glucosaminidase domain-containing protein [Symbiobacteriaceae bacterium]